ncbi:MAG: class I tRNA ligase family protein [Candidatus Zambryskibacteria bacterium]|nr:class I tRNA ligase family protein [Candidatus Zambryskibacteria bacterium]
MNGKFLKPYNPQETEGQIYKLWEESGFFNPDKLPERHKEPFSIVLPPPNVTGVLHLGSALMIAIEDMMMRFERMRGKKTLWIPGTDHASIATETKFLKEKKISRSDYSREEFVGMVNEYALENQEAIIKQIKAIGASLDWSRQAFTLDKERSRAVEEAFMRMDKAGLIYKGEKIVNWDPKGQTVISDDEIVHQEEKTKFYYLKYGPFTIATARPETKFGDKYVVMHPTDVRYKDYSHGQKLKVEWINGPITATVIKDDAIDMEFGTGVMTITPWHSQIDFDIAERHKLDKEQIIDKYGKLLPIAGEFAGMKISEARAKIIEKLKDKGLLIKEEAYAHNVATAERTGGIIEPQIMNQWFVDVNKPIKYRGNKSLKELMLEPIAEKKIKIIPEHFEKTYFHWIHNLRDWCISRQIWYGHKIPIEGETDTLDTWFSSALWTFSTLGWPEETEDLEAYYPTSVLETGYDILFFWIARMILMSQFLLGTIPFRTVYLHGLVRDEKNRKISKSLGNNIDPLDVIRNFGADALRMGLIIGTSPGNDSKVSMEKFKAYKYFSNKIWNIARFVLSKESGGEIDAKLKEEFDALAKNITEDMENYRFYLAAEKIYAYIWHRFADTILEESKKKPELNATLYYLLENSLKLLHPFMPFITEEIWREFKKDNILMIEKWPTP